MMDEFTAAATKGAFDAVSDLCKSGVSFLVSRGHKEAAKLSVALESGFRAYLERNYRKVSRIKTLLDTKTPTLVESVFESPMLSIVEKLYPEDDFLDFIKFHKYTTVTGMGGSGKSVFLKHLFIRFYNESHRYVPVYIELRNVPLSGSVKEYIHSQIIATVPSFEKDIFEYSLRNGKFIFLMDGLDEVDPAFSPSVVKQISELTYEFENNLFIVASRPDRTFESWNEFYTAEMQPLTQTQVLSLVKKLKFDRTKKKIFREAVKDHLYNSHGPYLANPLLCTMMLLTYSEGSGIPSKMHIFYQRAFDVLYYQHDASKPPTYQRKFKSKIEIDDFKNAFEAFCAFSYIDYGSSIGYHDVLTAIRKSLEYNGTSAKAADFLHDLCSSVSIMLRDGEQYTFLHRSFQEYFVALFMSHRDFKGWDKVLETICKEKPNDEVVALLYEINKDKFEKMFLKQRIRDLRRQIDMYDINTEPAAIFKLFYVGFTVAGALSKQRISSWTISRGSDRAKWSYMVNIIERDAMKFKVPFTRVEHSFYDWSAKVADLDKNNYREEMPNYFEVIKVTNECLIGTKLIDLLHQMKKHIIFMDNRIKSDEANRKKLVSTMLAKN